MGGEGSGTPKAALLKLDGTQIDLDGNVSKTDFFKFLSTPIEQFKDMEKGLTPAQALKFRNHIVRMKVGVSAAMPMLCGGNKCPNKTCPFHDGGGYPIAEPCIIENNLIAMWTKSYIEDMDIDIESRTEMVLVNELVECDIVDYRTNLGLAKDEDGWTLLKVDISVSDKGTQEITNLHPLLEAKEKARRARHQILESLAATRKEKYKKAVAFKQRDEKDIGTHFSDLKKALGVATSRANGASIKEIKAEADEMARKDKEEDIQDADWTMENDL
jgi:hypothetical protein